MRTVYIHAAIAALIVFSMATLGAQEVVNQPLTMQQAVDLALKYNPMIAGAQAMSDAADARVAMTKAMNRPVLSASVGATTATMSMIFNTPPNVMPSANLMFPGDNSTNGQLMLMAPLYTGGRLSSQIRASQHALVAATSDRDGVTLDVILGVKLAYLDCLLAKSETDVYQKYVSEEEERVRIAEAALAEGKIAKYDLLRNQADLARAQQQLIAAQRDLAVAVINLRAAIGINQDSDIALADTLASPATDNRTAGELTEYARSHRPDVAATAARVAAARATKDVAKSAYRPQLYLNAAQGFTSVSGGENESGYSVGVVAGIPILDGGLRHAAVREAEAEMSAVLKDEEKVTLTIQQEVRVAMADVDAAAKRASLSDAAVSQAEEDYRVIKLRYEAGKAINVEVLDALAILVEAQTARLAAIYDENAARVKLARAIGDR